MKILERVEALVGCCGIEKLKNATVLIVGLGGVGGYVSEFLARSGVGKLMVCDGDLIEPTNLNRQIISTKKNIGRNKANICKERLEEISDAVVECFDYDITANNVDQILNTKIDYIADCIDSVPDKIVLISKANEMSINIVSAMGTGNRLAPSAFKVMDIYKTSGDRLAKKMRHELRQKGIKSLNVVASDTLPDVVKSGNVSSIAYVPAISAGVISGFIINEILKNK